MEITLFYGEFIKPGQRQAEADTGPLTLSCNPLRRFIDDEPASLFAPENHNHPVIPECHSGIGSLQIIQGTTGRALLGSIITYRWRLDTGDGLLFDEKDISPVLPGASTVPAERG